MRGGTLGRTTRKTCGRNWRRGIFRSVRSYNFHSKSPISGANVGTMDAVRPPRPSLAERKAREADPKVPLGTRRPQDMAPATSSSTDEPEGAPEIPEVRGKPVTATSLQGRGGAPIEPSEPTKTGVGRGPIPARPPSRVRPRQVVPTGSSVGAPITPQAPLVAFPVAPIAMASGPATSAPRPAPAT